VDMCISDLLLARVTEIYSLSLHDALPISWPRRGRAAAPCSGPRDHPAARRSPRPRPRRSVRGRSARASPGPPPPPPSSRRRRGRSEEHTSELQSRENLVCRLLLDKNKFNL